MKYLAILKDSLREALDTKIIYVTLGISALFLLLLASLSFRAVPAEEQFRRSAELMTRLLGYALKGKGPKYGIEEFQGSDPSAPPWQQTYRFYYTLEFQDEKDAEEVRSQKALKPTDFEKQLKQQYPWIGDLEVTEAEPANPKEFRFLAQIKSTKVADRREWVYEPALFFGALPMSFFQSTLAGQVEFITNYLIGTFGAGITMLLSTIITAFFIPNMLRKGTVDMLLAKPIHRTVLLVYKYIGGLTFMFLNTLVIMGGIWLVLGVRTNLWMPGLLLCVFIFTFQFAIFYSVSTLTAVLTRSPIVAILAAVAVWGLLFLIGIGFRFVDGLRPEKLADMREQEREMMPHLPGWLFVTADVVHFVTPHYKDLDALATKVIRSDLVDPSSSQRKDVDKEVGSIKWTESLSVTIVYIALFVGLSCLWFATRDY